MLETGGNNKKKITKKQTKTQPQEKVTFEKLQDDGFQKDFIFTFNSFSILFLLSFNYDIFNFPREGEAGGLASGTEAWYSFDYGNVHFISLNTEDVDFSVDMCIAEDSNNLTGDVCSGVE